jgi:hypothetical protein
MVTLEDPKRSPSKWDKLSAGPDCAVHPLIGNVVAQNGTSPEEQTRNYLRSLLKSGQVTGPEFKTLWGKLIAWEQAGNTVPMPSRAGNPEFPHLNLTRTP